MRFVRRPYRSSKLFWRALYTTRILGSASLCICFFSVFFFYELLADPLSSLRCRVTVMLSLSTHAHFEPCLHIFRRCCGTKGELKKVSRRLGRYSLKVLKAYVSVRGLKLLVNRVMPILSLLRSLLFVVPRLPCLLCLASARIHHLAPASRTVMARR